MPNIRTRSYLVLEDKEDFIQNTYRPIERDVEHDPDRKISLCIVKTREDALQQLEERRFTGAIIDLHLAANDDEAKGNEVAKRIHEDYFMPVAIVTAFANDLDDSLREIADRKSGLLRLFNKNQDVKNVFEFLLNVQKSEILEVLGPGGEFNRILSKVFWNHLGESIERLGQSTVTPEIRRRALRQTVTHMVNILQREDCGDWDDYQSEEVYIWPPMGNIPATGDIFLEENKESGKVGKAAYVLITPACDLEKPGRTVADPIHLLAIIPFSELSHGRLEGIFAKNNTRYHLLPPTAAFEGGIVDFWQIVTVSGEKHSDFKRVGTIIEPFAKDIVARFGSWVSRQGSPNLTKEAVFVRIEAQLRPATSGNPTSVN